MGRIPDNIISDILERADILQIIGEYVQLKRAGQNHKGLCPFHGEKTPSFTVSPDRGFFKCFGCGEGGTVYSFLMKLEGWSFPEAVRHVAGRVGIDIPEVNEEEAEVALQKRKERESYLNIQGLAREFFEENLWGTHGADARQYLLERGVDEEAARVFGLGYAPDGWSGLLDHLRKHSIGNKAAEKAGLAIEGRRGSYDRFRDRIMFPVLNIFGKAVAFGGRRLKDDGENAGAKYINSPETSFYTKGSEVYGLAQTKKAIRDEGRALLVEGNFDVVVLYARGVKNAVAPMGTALTDRQTKLLSRFTKRVFVAFDGDKAGREATVRSLPILLRHQLDARVVNLPDGDDPDSLIQREGQEALRKALGRARPIVAHAVDQIIRPLEMGGAPIEEKVEAMGRIGEILHNVKDNLTWKHYAKEISRRLDIDLNETHRLLRGSSAKESKAKLKKARSAPAQGLPQSPRAAQSPAWMDEEPPPADEDSFRGEPSEDQQAQRQKHQIPRLEGQCLQIIADMPKRLSEFVEANCCQLMTDERLVILIERVYERQLKTQKKPQYNLIAQDLSNELGDDDFFSQVSALLCEDRSYTDEKMDRTYLDTITELQRQWIKTEEKKIQRLLATVEKSTDAAMKVLFRQRELNKLRAELDVRLQRKRL